MRVYDFNRLITGLHVYSSITYIDLNQQQIASRYNCTVNLTGKIRSNRTPLLPVVSELHTMKLLSKQLTNWEDWILSVLKIIETDVSHTIQRRNSKHSFVQLSSLFEYKMSVLCSNGCLNAPSKSFYVDLPFVCDILKAHLQSCCYSTLNGWC